MKINSALSARSCIGKQVFWDDTSVRYIFDRTGILEAVKGTNVCIDGDWKTRSSLTNLRSVK